MTLRGSYWYWRHWWRRHGLLIHPVGVCRLCGRPVRWSTRRARRTAKGRLYCGAVCRGVVDAAAHAGKKPAESWGVSQGPAPITDLEPERLPPTPRRCPFPYKRAYDDETVARRAFTDLLLHDPTIDVYRCRCLRWHAGHRPDHLREPAYRPGGYVAGTEVPDELMPHQGETIMERLDPEVADRLLRLIGESDA